MCGVNSLCSVMLCARSAATSTGGARSAPLKIDCTPEGGAGRFSFCRLFAFMEKLLYSNQHDKSPEKPAEHIICQKKGNEASDCRTDYACDYGKGQYFPLYKLVFGVKKGGKEGYRQKEKQIYPLRSRL